MACLWLRANVRKVKRALAILGAEGSTSIIHPQRKYPLESFFPKLFFGLGLLRQNMQLHFSCSLCQPFTEALSVTGYPEKKNQAGIYREISCKELVYAVVETGEAAVCRVVETGKAAVCRSVVGKGRWNSPATVEAAVHRWAFFSGKPQLCS